MNNVSPPLIWPRISATLEDTEMFTIAIICALKLELDAVINLLDDDPYTVPHVGKQYGYLSATFAGHKVLLVKPPEYGNINAALAVQDIQEQFGKMELTLLVGVCGGVPQPQSTDNNVSEPVFLGDVVVRNSTVGYMYASRFGPRGPELRNAIPQRVSSKLLQILDYLGTDHFMQQLTASSAAVLRQFFNETKYNCPGESNDLAFESTYHHIHRDGCSVNYCDAKPPKVCQHAKMMSCNELKCDIQHARRRPPYTARPRRIHVGTYASADVVMRKPDLRDSLAKDYNVLAFDMEASGISQLNVAYLVIKSVSDYGDSHKHKDWQNFAAACAAATAKVFVECFYPQAHQVRRMRLLRMHNWTKSAMHRINARRQALLTTAMLETCYTSLPDHLVQSFVHTKSFQEWLQGKTKFLIASTLPRTAQLQHGTFGAQKTPSTEKSVPLQYGNSHMVASLAQCAAQKSPSCRIFYINCSWVLEPPERARARRIEGEHAEQDSSVHCINLTETLLFLQMICSHPQPEQLLLQYTRDFLESDFLEFKLTILEDGLPPSRYMPPLINYMLTKSRWGEFILAISNIGLMKLSAQTALLKHFEALCASPRIKACIAVPLRPHITAQYGHLPVVYDVTEYNEFLASLCFQDMEVRRTQVSPPTLETNNWIWNNVSYMEFSQKDSGILWIQGKLGSGKSVLAKFIHDTLLRLPSETVSKDSNSLVGDWFYHRRGGSRFIQHRSFLRSILYHFSKQCRDVFTSFCLGSYRSMDPGNVSWPEEVLEGIILNVCRGPVPVICIVDAVDEAENTNVLSMIKSFVDETYHSKAKFIVLSRPAVAIERQIIGFPTIIMEAENESDIKTIVCKGLASLPMALHTFPMAAQPSKSAHCMESRAGSSRPRQPRSKSIRITMAHESNILQEIQKLLIYNAQGSVLWVKLVLDQLQWQATSQWPCTLVGLKQAAMRIPPKMKEYYVQIAMEMTAGRSEKDIQEIHRILKWICAATEIDSVTLEMLWEAMAVMEDDCSSSIMDEIYQKRIPIMTFDELWHKVSVICGPFIAIYNPGLPMEESRNSNYGATSVVQVMHKSVQDFLTEGSSAGQLSFTIAQAQHFIKRHLKNYMQIIARYVQGSNVGQALSCKELVDYLEERKLLRLALHMLKHDDDFESSTYSRLNIPALTKPSETSSEHHLASVLKSDWRTFGDLSCAFGQQLNLEDNTKDTGINMTLLLSANRLFYKACSEGLITAVWNMLALKWERAPQAGMTEKPIILYGVIFALSMCQIGDFQVGTVVRTGRGVHTGLLGFDKPVTEPEKLIVQVAVSGKSRPRVSYRKDPRSHREFNPLGKLNEFHHQMEELHSEEQQTEQSWKGRTRRRDAEQRRPEVHCEDSLVSRPWEVTLTVYPKKVPTEGTFYFTSWSGYLDLVCGPSRLQHSQLDDADEEERKDFLEDVERAIATAILGGRSSFGVRPSMPRLSMPRGGSYRPVVVICTNRKKGNSTIYQL